MVLEARMAPELQGKKPGLRMAAKMCLCSRLRTQNARAMRDALQGNTVTTGIASKSGLKANALRTRNAWRATSACTAAA